MHTVSILFLKWRNTKINGNNNKRTKVLTQPWQHHIN